MEGALNIRGIYATALTRFFLDKGVSIVSPSEEIVNRFGTVASFSFDRPSDVALVDWMGDRGSC